MKTIDTSITDSQGVISIQVKVPHNSTWNYGIKAAPVRDYVATGFVIFFAVYAACLAAKWTYDKFIKSHPQKNKGIQ